MPIYDLYGGSAVPINFSAGDSITNIGGQVVYYSATQDVSIASAQLAIGVTQVLLGTYWLLVAGPGGRGRVNVVQTPVQVGTDIDLSGYVTQDGLIAALAELPAITSSVRRVPLGVLDPFEIVDSLPSDAQLLIDGTLASASTVQVNGFPGLLVTLLLTQPATGSPVTPVVPQARGETVPWTLSLGATTMATFQFQADGSSMYYLGGSSTDVPSTPPTVAVSSPTTGS